METQTEIDQLTDVQLPTLELADVKSLVICIQQLTIQVILQVDIVQEYRDTQTEINQLSDVQLPTLNVADVKSLAVQGWQQTT